MAEVKAVDLSSIPYLLKMGHNNYWVDYDEDTDTLYVSFRKPQSARDSIMQGDAIYHYDGEEIVGITILHAKQFTTN